MKFKRGMKSVNMKKLFRRNQIIVTTLAVMIAAAGYLNYTSKQELEAGNVISEAGMMDISDEDILMENQKVLDSQNNYEEILSLDQDLSDIEEAESLAEGGLETGEDIQQIAQAETLSDQAGMEAGAQEGISEDMSETQAGYENPGEAILTSGMSVADYIAGVQLSREQVRAKNKDTLLAIINNANIEESAKQQAIQDMIRLTDIAEKENAAETLLLAKGFSDPVVSISSDKVDVVVNASSITDAQRAGGNIVAELESRNTHKVYEKDKIGEVQIADEVVAIIAGLAATEVEGVDSMAGNITNELVGRLGMKNLSKGVKVDVTEEHVSVDLSLNIKYGYNIPTVSEKVQDKVKSAIENMTGLNVLDVNIKIASVNMEESR